MRVYFWGTRGSLPTSVSSAMIEEKIFRALKISRRYSLSNDDALRDFIRTGLPFDVRNTYGGNTSCVEIGGLEDYVLCDAGTGLRDFSQAYMKAAAAGQNDLPRTFHIFISHPHWDHIQGFPFFTPAYIPGYRIHIYGYHKTLETSFIRQQEAPFFPVPLQEMGADITFHVLSPESSYRIAGMDVNGIRQNHPGDSFGYRFEKDARRIVYSTDSEHRKEAGNSDYTFVQFCKQADLLIFDAQYSLLEAIDAKENWGHSNNLVGVELAVRAGVRRLCLFHSEHTCDDTALERILNDTQKYAGIVEASSPLEIHLAYDGLELKI